MSLTHHCAPFVDFDEGGGRGGVGQLGWTFTAISARSRSRGGRIETRPEAIALFARSLGPDDEVALEATGGSVAIARILEGHVRRVVLANAADVRAISHARVKSDRFDARTLARLLAADLIPGVWVPDERTATLRRRVARRAALVRQLIRTKNELHAVVMRCLLGRPPATDLFGVKGRAWLNAQVLAEAEAETAEDGKISQPRAGSA